MIEAAFLVIGLVVGVIVGWLVANIRRVAAEARLEEAKRQADDQKRLLDDAKQQLTDAFKALSSDALKDSNQAFLDLAKATFDAVMADAKGDLGKRQEAIDNLIKPLETQLREMEKSRHQAYGALEEQLKSLATTEQQLQRETGSLVTALRRPEVRGRWGEITLERVVELAGLSEHCDFQRQPAVATDDGRLRPDLSVTLPQGRTVVVDAKAPLDAYLAAVEATDDATRSDAMRRHASHVRAHILQLSSKEYWTQLPSAPDFVVLFLPGESFFSAAVEQDRELIEFGIEKRVLLATPTTLIALLRVVALSWHQQQIIENAQAIESASRELFARVNKFAEHLGGIHDGLKRACNAFSDAVGSWQRRVVPQGRRVVELGGAGQAAEMSELEAVEAELRELPTSTEETPDA